MGIYKPAKLIRKPRTKIFARMRFAVLLKNVINLLAILDILTNPVIVALFRASERVCRWLNDLKAYTTGFDFVDMHVLLVLMLHLVTEDDSGRLERAVREGFDYLSLDVFVIHIPK